MSKNYHYKEKKRNKKAEYIIYAVLGVMVVAIIALVIAMFAKGPTNATGVDSALDNSCCESIKIVRSINL